MEAEAMILANIKPKRAEIPKDKLTKIISIYNFIEAIIWEIK